jgi:hypothetical protein
MIFYFFFGEPRYASIACAVKGHALLFLDWHRLSRYPGTGGYCLRKGQYLERTQIPGPCENDDTVSRLPTYCMCQRFPRKK